MAQVHPPAAPDGDPQAAIEGSATNQPVYPGT